MFDLLRVLLVEDSEDDALLIERELRRGGWELKTQRVDNRDDMRQAIEESLWDLIICDHNMPQFDSTGALAVVQDSKLDIPVIIVSGSIGEELAIAAMRSGVQDYIMKDGLGRLLPAVEREIKEAKMRCLHRQAEDTVRHMAFHDALTNLVNRTVLERRLERCLVLARHQTVKHSFMYLDLDQFKVINDTCGHFAGDELIRQVALVLQESVREHDTVARLGGDEFGVLLEGCPIEQAQRIADNIRQRIQGFRFSWQDKVFGVGISIGLTSVDHACGTVSDILSTADLACNAAKDMGRNRVSLYRSDDQDLVRRHGEMQWMSRLSQAHDEGRFVLYRQAIVPTAITGPASDEPENRSRPLFEFLIRLQEPDGAIVLPSAFIPAAERYNFMPIIDRWVITTAFSYLARMIAQPRHLSSNAAYFINLSGASLSDSQFFGFIREQLQAHRLPPECICFEVTETAAIARLAETVEFIKGIRELGCQFALDDFGAGLSSFSYLKTIPADYLKIDGNFVRNMLQDPMDHAIVEVINQIGHTANLRTIAEFVEDSATRQRLHSIGVDFVQGYGIERPAPLPELTARQNGNPQMRAGSSTC